MSADEFGVTGVSSRSLRRVAGQPLCSDPRELGPGPTRVSPGASGDVCLRVGEESFGVGGQEPGAPAHCRNQLPSAPRAGCPPSAAGGPRLWPRSLTPTSVRLQGHYVGSVPAFGHCWCHLPNLRVGAEARPRYSGSLGTDCKRRHGRRRRSPVGQPPRTGSRESHGPCSDKRPLVLCRAGGQASLRLNMARSARERFR